MMHFTSGNQIKLLRNGAEYFPALADAIQNAQHEVYLQTYIYEFDSTGISIGNALKEAAMRGVGVNVLLDGFGSKDLPKAYISELKKSGVQVMFYRPKISPWTLQKARLRRMHRKVAVIDKEISFVGGINIIDDHNTPNQITPRIDYAVMIKGPILTEIKNSVEKLWHRMAWLNFKIAHIKMPALKTKLVQPVFDFGVKVAYVIRDNVLHRHDIEKAYLNAISEAKTEIIIANAYFIPGRKFRQALLRAASRGITIKLLLQGRKEYILMFATHAFYSKFLNAGVEIYEYRKSFMHSKVAVIDNNWATVGSSNIDPFSLLLANEANVVIEDINFAQELKSDIEISIQNAFHVTLETWEQDSKLKNFFSWVIYGLVKVFLSIVGNNDDKK
jgi:cardiolipin synthase A/B